MHQTPWNIDVIHAKISVFSFNALNNSKMLNQFYILENWGLKNLSVQGGITN